MIDLKNKKLILFKSEAKSGEDLFLGVGEASLMSRTFEGVVIASTNPTPSTKLAINQKLQCAISIIEYYDVSEENSAISAMTLIKDLYSETLTPNRLTRESITPDSYIGYLRRLSNALKENYQVKGNANGK